MLNKMQSAAMSMSNSSEKKECESDWKLCLRGQTDLTKM